MTVQDLINKLQKFDKGMLLMVGNDYDNFGGSNFFMELTEIRRIRIRKETYNEMSWEKVETDGQLDCINALYIC